MLDKQQQKDFLKRLEQDRQGAIKYAEKHGLMPDEYGYQQLEDMGFEPLCHVTVGFGMYKMGISEEDFYIAMARCQSAAWELIAKQNRVSRIGGGAEVTVYWKPKPNLIEQAVNYGLKPIPDTSLFRVGISKEF